MRKVVLSLLFSFLQVSAFSQPAPISFQFVSEFEYSWTYSSYSALFDDQDRPYIYTANNELGFMVYDISDIYNPVPVDTMMPSVFSALKVSNIVQDGNYIYASLGGFQGIAQRAGMAILNISDPENVMIEDQWDSAAFNQGCAITIVDGNYAYLGAMETGIIILDVSDKSDIRFVSVYHPDPNWPHTPGLFSTPNARGMTIRNDTLYLCYDAGAFRVIDVTDKQNPVEIGHYINPTLDATAQPAYNNAVLVDHYAYVTVDYCGIDIVDISDPTNPVNAGWVNPWNCTTTNWNGRPGHTNHLLTFSNNQVLFVSGGDTEILAYDISDRENPVELGSFFALQDSMVAWGIDVKQNYAVLAQVDNPFGQPYLSDWGGIRILHWEGGVTGINSHQATPFSRISVYPNPASDKFTLISHDTNIDKQISLKIIDVTGRVVLNKTADFKQQPDISVTSLENGIYTLIIETPFIRQFNKLLVTK